MNIVATYTNRPLVVTGFGDEMWTQCQPISIDRYWSGEPAVASRHAEARICWSSEALHVRFVGVQHEALVVNESPRTDQKTLGLWDRDVCEIFLAPDASEPWRYFEFETAPTGEWVDLGITVMPSGRVTDWDYASGFSSAATLEDERLLVGMRIPWSQSIPKPERETIWRTNLFRCAGPEAPERYLAWQPTMTEEPNFHVPEAFGTLRFE